MNKYAIKKNEEFVQHYPQLGFKQHYVENKLEVLVFDTKKGAQEVSKVLTGKTKVVIFE